MNITSKNVSQLFPLNLGAYVIVRTTQRIYVGEVLDIYRKGNSGRYDSIKTTSSLGGVKYLSLRVYLPMDVVRLSYTLQCI